jgi:hypothetical protein
MKKKVLLVLGIGLMKAGGKQSENQQGNQIGRIDSPKAIPIKSFYGSDLSLIQKAKMNAKTT